MLQYAIVLVSYEHDAQNTTNPGRVYFTIFKRLKKTQKLFDSEHEN